VIDQFWAASKQHIDSRVNQILADLAIEDPAPLKEMEAVCFARGVDEIRDGCGNGVEAWLARSPRRTIVAVGAHLSLARRRLALAHELGHVELHEAVSQAFVCETAEMLSIYKASDVEREANYFGAVLLMPTRFALPAVTAALPRIDAMKGLADRFGTSLTASALRFTELTADECAVVLSKNGAVSWWRAGGGFAGFIKRGPLDEYTFAHDVAHSRSIPSGPQRVDADAWLSSRFQSEDFLFEESTPLGSTGVVLSVLTRP